MPVVRERDDRACSRGRDALLRAGTVDVPAMRRGERRKGAAMRELRLLDR